MLTYMSLLNGSKVKINKKEESYDKVVFSPKIEIQNGTRRGRLSTIHIFIHIHQYSNPVWRPCKSTVLMVNQTQRRSIVNGISLPY